MEDNQITIQYGLDSITKTFTPEQYGDSIGSILTTRLLSALNAPEGTAVLQDGEYVDLNNSIEFYIGGTITLEKQAATKN